MRHYCKFRNEEVIILGYRKTMNSVMVCRVAMLPADEQANLRQIASSSYAQSKCDYLIPILTNERHKSGSDWFTYLASRLQRNDGSVVVLPLKEMEEMDNDQKAFFKGWGTSVDEARKLVEENEAKGAGVGPSTAGEKIEGYTPVKELDDTYIPHNQSTPPVAEVELPDISTGEAKPYVDREAMMLKLMEQMAEGQKQIADGLASLEKKVGARKTTTRKAVRKAKPARKAAAPQEEAPAAE